MPDRGRASPPPSVEPWHLGYRPGLDGLRAVAVSLVIAAHLAIPHMAGGVIGVDIFFVLSGFLITGLLVEELRRTGQVDYRGFYRRRAFRLFPALVILLPAISLAAHVIPTIDRETANQTTNAVPWIVLYVANWARATGTQLGLFGHTWSLAIEEQFYLLWPAALVALISSRLGRTGAALLALAGAGVVAVHRGIDWYGGAGIDRVSNGTDMRADALLIGCALALAMHAGWNPRPNWMVVASATGFLAFVVWTQNGLSPFLYLGGLTGVSLCSAVLLVALSKTPGPFSSRPLVALGRISYGLYLWHFPIVFLTPLGWPLMVRVAVVVGATLAAASVSWLLVERRFLHLRRYARPELGARRLEAPRPG